MEFASITANSLQSSANALATKGWSAGLKEIKENIKGTTESMYGLHKAASYAGAGMAILGKAATTAMSAFMWIFMAKQAFDMVREWMKTDETKAKEESMKKLEEGYKSLTVAAKKYSDHLAVAAAIEESTTKDTIDRAKLLSNAAKSWADEATAQLDNISASITVTLRYESNKDVLGEDLATMQKWVDKNQKTIDKGLAAPGSFARNNMDTAANNQYSHLKTADGAAVEDFDKLKQYMKEATKLATALVSEENKESIFQYMDSLPKEATARLESALVGQPSIGALLFSAREGDGDISEEEYRKIIAFFGKVNDEYAFQAKAFSDTTLSMSMLPSKDVTDYFKTVFPEAMGKGQAAVVGMSKTLTEAIASIGDVGSDIATIPALKTLAEQSDQTMKRLGLSSNQILTPEILARIKAGTITAEDFHKVVVAGLEDAKEAASDFALSLAPLVTKGLGNKLLVDTQEYYAAVATYSQVVQSYNDKEVKTDKDKALLRSASIGMGKAMLQLLKEQKAVEDAIAETGLLINGRGAAREKILAKQHEAQKIYYDKQRTIAKSREGITEAEKESLDLLYDQQIITADLAEAERIRLKGITDYNAQLKLASAQMAFQAALEAGRKLTGVPYKTPGRIKTNARKEQIEADAKAEASVGYATAEAQAISEAAPVTTFVAPVAVDPFADVAVATPSTQPLSEDSLDDEAELVEATPFIETRTKAEPISIFG